jgi:hypothetical protein
MKKLLLITTLFIGMKSYAQHDEPGHEGHNHGAGGHPASIPAVQAPVVPKLNAAKIEFKESTYDFGSIPEGPEAKHVFDFLNSGKEPLTIISCQASCGCTVPQCPKEPILPGQTGKITSIYNTAGRVGPFTKSITVSTNAEGMPTILYIKGTVKETPAEKTMPINEDGGMMMGN